MYEDGLGKITFKVLHLKVLSATHLCRQSFTQFSLHYNWDPFAYLSAIAHRATAGSGPSGSARYAWLTPQK